MILVSHIQPPFGAMFSNSSTKFITSISPQQLFSHNQPPKFNTIKTFIRPLHLTLAKAEGNIDSSSSPTKPSSFANDQTVFVGDKDVPLEGVIQFDKPNNSSSRIEKWG